MEKKFTIYYHKSPENKYYIGQTCQDLEARWRNGKGYHSVKFTEAIEYFGWENFEHGILEENISKDKIDEREAYYIQLFNSVENGYNTYKQNYSGYHFSDLWSNDGVREKIINTLTEQRNTPEYHEKQSKMMVDLWKTQEYRESQKKAWTEERKEELSERTKKCWEDEEYRKKISDAQSEYRKKDWQNPEYRRKMCVQVECVETGQIFDSVKEAAEWCGVKSNTLSSALKSKTHRSGRHPESGIDLHWRRVDGVGKGE